ncbi:MAG: hypothetical protein ABJA33_12660 [Pedococcus sp.]
MNTATRVSVFAAGLVLAFGAALGAGQLIGPLGSIGPANAQEPHPGMTANDHGDTGGTDGHAASDGGHDAPGASVAPAGLSATDQGYQLVPGATTVAPSASARVTFRVLGPDGQAVTGFTTAHERRLHLIVVRRDLSGFQHVHPTMAADGTWSVALDLSRPGQWRMFADFDPEGATEGLVLGTDLAVPGDYTPVAVPAPQTSTAVEGYTVRADGTLDPRDARPVDFAITRTQGSTVDLEPYLGADGHLVVLREGDLAYAHAHAIPSTAEGTPDAGTVGFQVQAPGPGRYRMFLDFKTSGTVHTAAFTADAGRTTP